ncbi:ABC transporter ATP-binding protein [Candidatus Enterococcus ferrettii]|uniref:ABC transporter domain-containing protein n=1 Tax=Candidatus Enterococcus ferrettii TaxID=2815324 RepID=A0ABV0ET19_9ENTE|nr:ABC transporter ATP-binding protein [Enterococcus sp. 665A]MBO1341171.1 ABC transporter ATP-binding protein [Enterococcus sp. 665A]
MEIIIKNLNQFYGKKQVLHDINLEIETGMYGLLGRNGAGKSTLMKTLVTLLPVKAGIVRMADISVERRKEIRGIVGYLPQDFSMYGNMTVYDAMDYLAVLSDIKKGERKKQILNLLEQVNLSAYQKNKVKAMSGGMRRRLGIAQALLNDPQILIVDEPTAGLDPEERLRFRNLLSEISENKIVLLSTHIAGDIEAVAEQLAILDEGRIIFAGKVNELLDEAEGNIYEIDLPRTELASMKKQVEVISLHPDGANTRIRFIGKIGSLIMEHPLVRQVQPTLEDAYLYCLSEQVGDHS